MPGDLITQMRPLPQSLSFPCNRFYSLYQLAPSSRDEPDNNTHQDFLQIGNLKPRYAMDDRFHREDERLKTFENWPLDFVDRHELAMSGMFYMGDSDKTKCYFCEVEIGRWEREDQPVPEHLRFSPNCPLLRRRTTNNVPINVEQLERILPAPSYDICGANDIEVRRNAFPEGTIPAAHLRTDVPPGSPAVASSSTSTATTAGAGGSFFPEFPEYAIETARLRSFAEWPRLMKQKPEQLSEAGFFYTGVGDRVKCFSCGGGLKDWDEDDEPWEQHALWMNKCRFLKLMKGEAFIENVASKFKKSEATAAPLTPPTPSTPNSMTSSSSSSSSSEEEGEPLAVSMEMSSDVKPPTATNPTVMTTLLASPQATRIHSIACSGGLAVEDQKKSHTTIPEEKLCKICYVNEYNTAFLPCGHVVACAKCASSVTKCPMCRKRFADVMRVYFS